MKDGLVSVIMPLYNAEPYVEAAIDSIFSQSYQNLEIIVIDDGSTDRGAERVKGFGDKVVFAQQSNLGISAARNRAIEMSTGDYVAFLDADDLWTPEKLEIQIAALQEDGTLDTVFGFAKQFFSPDLSEEAKKRLVCPPDAAPGYLASSMLIKRDSFLKVGLFDTSTKVGEFIDWFARAKEANLKIKMLPNLVLKRRIHEENTSLQHRRGGVDFTQILKASIDRRRQKEQNHQ